MTAEIFAVNLCHYCKTGFTMSAEKNFWNLVYMRSQTRQPFLRDPNPQPAELRFPCCSCSGDFGSIPVNPGAGATIRAIMTPVKTFKTPLRHPRASTGGTDRFSRNDKSGKTTNEFIEKFY